MCFSTWENCVRFKIHTSLLNVGWSGYWTSCLELPLVLVNWIHWYVVQLEFLQISLGKRKGHLVTCIAPKTLCFTVKLQQQTSGSHLLLWQTCDWFLPHHIALTTVIKYLSLFGTRPIIGLHSETMHIFSCYIKCFSIEPRTDCKTCRASFPLLLTSRMQNEHAILPVA